jgi:hypothetical protein
MASNIILLHQLREKEVVVYTVLGTKSYEGKLMQIMDDCVEIEVQEPQKNDHHLHARHGQC